MKLPKLPVSIFETILPSTQEKVRFRPYLAGEEKILLLAQEGDESDMIVALKQIVQSCVLEPKIDVDTMASFDLIYLLIQLRSKSDGEIINLTVRGDQSSSCEQCQKPINYSLNLEEIKVTFPENHTKKLMLEKTLGLMMRYPTFSELANVGASDPKQTLEKYFDMISSSIDYIFDDKRTYPLKDAPAEEIQEFVNSLSKPHLAKIEEFFRTMPYINHTIKLKCSACQKEREIVVEGVEAFFGFC